MSRDSFLIKLYKQLVRPHLEYAACVWSPYWQRDKLLLEKVQRRATKCAQGMAHKSYELLLSALKLDLLQKRRNIFDLIEVFKIVGGLSAIEFTLLFTPHKSPIQIRFRFICYLCHQR